MRRIVALSVTAFLLAACSPEAPGGGEAQPPADAPAPPPADGAGAEFKVDFSALGNEPFWRVDVKGTDITLTRPGESGPAPETTQAANAGMASTAESATWTGQAGTVAVVVKVTRGECSDGMSDNKYPYVAEVTWGAERLKGCGFETAKQPREGQP